MNITILERVARMALRGEHIETESMVKRGVITPAEHRSLESLSSHIAANARALTIDAGSGVVALKETERIWA